MIHFLIVLEIVYSKLIIFGFRFFLVFFDRRYFRLAFSEVGKKKIGKTAVDFFDVGKMDVEKTEIGHFDFGFFAVKLLAIGKSDSYFWAVTHQRDENGRFVLRLPCKDSIINLHGSFYKAKSMLLKSEKPKSSVKRRYRLLRFYVSI